MSRNREKPEMTEQTQGPNSDPSGLAPKKRRKKWPWITGGVLGGLLVVFVIIGATAPSPPAGPTNKAKPTPTAQTAAQACAAQAWPQPVPNVVGQNLSDAGGGVLTCFALARATAPDGHDVMNDPASEAYRWRIVSLSPPVGTLVALNTPIMLTLIQGSP